MTIPLPQCMYFRKTILLPKKIDPTTITHTDLLGKRVELGSVVATNYFSRALVVCTVVEVLGKSVKLRKYGASNKAKTFLRHPGDVMVIDGEDLTMYILRKGMK